MAEVDVYAKIANFDFPPGLVWEVTIPAASASNGMHACIAEVRERSV